MNSMLVKAYGTTLVCMDCGSLQSTLSTAYDSIVTSFKWWYSSLRRKQNCHQIFEFTSIKVVVKYLRFSYTIPLLRGNLCTVLAVLFCWACKLVVAQNDLINGSSPNCQGVSCTNSGTLMILSFFFHFVVSSIPESTIVWFSLSLHRCTISYTMNGCHWVHVSV